MIGPLTVAPAGFNHVLVAANKFTKWIEYKPIVKISSDRAVDFISDIIHRFGFPHTIITDLGSNFTSQSFWDFCDNSCIEVKYASVAHPQANGQVEHINGLVLDGLKKRLYNTNTKKGGKWIQERSLAKQLDSLLSSSPIGQRLYYPQISCRNLQE